MRHPVEESKIKHISRQLQKLFDKASIEEEALRTGFVQRFRQLGGSDFAQLCIQGVTKDGMAASLTELCAIALDLGAEICPQSLNERFDGKGAELMRRLFGMVLRASLGDGDKLALLEQFSGGVFLEDATIAQLPECLSGLYKGSGGGGSTAALKIDCLMDIRAGKWHLHLKDGASSDTAGDLLGVPERSLWLRDLGYFKIKDFCTIDSQGAFFLSRHRTDVSLYLASQPDKRISLVSWSRQMRVGEVRDVKVLVGKDKRGPFRLVVQKVPKKTADAKRHKLRTDKQNKRKGLTEERLELCCLNIYLTNLDAEEWPPLLVMELYRIRWQIELLFKAWKSTLKLGRARPMKHHRFLCLLYGQLIWALLNSKIVLRCKVLFWNDADFEVSEMKAYKIIRVLGHRLREALARNCQRLYQAFLESLFAALGKFGGKQYKKGNKNKLLCLS